DVAARLAELRRWLGELERGGGGAAIGAALDDALASARACSEAEHAEAYATAARLDLDEGDELERLHASGRAAALAEIALRLRALASPRGVQTSRHPMPRRRPIRQSAARACRPRSP